ncbi:phosphoribosyltransferase family protein [Horticoccus sp. 23ND18S-11]|uniref:phosphoribosyltransferase family protein n=1 Tax=Horticoccus sp. 23ND18S-11 TaxID=3391832 RepID=UPI0039C9D54A
MNTFTRPALISTFRDRVEAGRLLAAKLSAYAGRPNALVLALPRGGVPVGFEVAHALQLPLEVLVVRKLGVPGHEELAMGAIASGGMLYRNERVLASFHVTPAALASALQHETAELERREHLFRGSRPPLQVKGRTLIVVDDGIATGSTMRAALQALATGEPAAVVVAAPVIAADTARDLQEDAGKVVAVLTPDNLNAIGQFYADFQPTSDTEVKRLLAACTTAGGCPAAKPRRPKTRAPAHAGAARSVPPQWAWHFRTLLALRNHLLCGGGDRLRDPGEAMEPPSVHGVDLMDELYDRELGAALPRRTDEAVVEVEAALQRMEQGTYGICAVTGRPIPPAELRALPWRRTAASPRPRRRAPVKTPPLHDVKRPATA